MVVESEYKPRLAWATALSFWNIFHWNVWLKLLPAKSDSHTSNCWARKSYFSTTRFLNFPRHWLLSRVINLIYTAASPNLCFPNTQLISQLSRWRRNQGVLIIWENRFIYKQLNLICRCVGEWKSKTKRRQKQQQKFRQMFIRSSDWTRDDLWKINNFKSQRCCRSPYMCCIYICTYVWVCRLHKARETAIKYWEMRQQSDRNG